MQYSEYMDTHLTHSTPTNCFKLTQNNDLTSLVQLRSVERINTNNLTCQTCKQISKASIKFKILNIL